MKNILNIIKTLLITGAITILTIIPVMADEQITNTHINYKNDTVTEYKDGITTVINTNTNVYELYVPEFGDYDVTCNNKKELNNLILEYRSHINDTSDLVNTIKHIESTNTYYKYDSSIVTEFNNNSWSLVNYNTNKFIFTPAELTDFEINCKSESELKNLIQTYKSCKEFGYF